MANVLALLIEIKLLQKISFLFTIRVSDGKRVRLQNARKRYEEWCRGRETRKYEVNRACTELIERVMTMSHMRDIKRECLYELESVVRKKIDQRNLESSGHHLVGKRKRARLRKYKLRTVTIPAETETEKGETDKSIVIEVEKVTEKLTENDKVETRDMRGKIPRHRKIISPGILKISKIFEKSENEQEGEKMEKQENNVTRIRNSLELMMSNTKVRKTKYEVKKGKKKPVLATENEAPQRKLMEGWIRRDKFNGLSDLTQEKSDLGKKVPVKRNMSRESEKNENGHESESVEKAKVTKFTASRPYVVLKNVRKQETGSSKQGKVESVLPKSRHRKGSESEKSFGLKTEGIGQKFKNEKSVQKEKVLEGKVKIWDHFFGTERAVLKNSETFKVGPILNEKWKENAAGCEPNQTEKKKQELSKCLRGTNSLRGKGQNNGNQLRSTFLYSTGQKK